MYTSGDLKKISIIRIRWYMRLFLCTVCVEVTWSLLYTVFIKYSFRYRVLYAYQRLINVMFIKLLFLYRMVVNIKDYLQFYWINNSWGCLVAPGVVSIQYTLYSNSKVIYSYPRLSQWIVEHVLLFVIIRWCAFSLGFVRWYMLQSM